MEKERHSSSDICISNWVGAGTRKWKWQTEQSRSWTKESNEVSLENVLEVIMEHVGGDSCWRLDIWF